ncbi:response regulator [Rheinheimera gaetbuli]
MALLTGCWHYFDRATQQRAQLEQFASTLQLSVVPLLQSRDQALVQAQLNHMRYVSALPITALAVYDQQHRLIAGTDAADTLLAYRPNTAVTTFTMQRHGLQWLVQQPLTPKHSSKATTRNELESAYILLLVTHDMSYTDWLVPLAIVLFIGLMVLKTLQSTLQQAASRQHTDISLLTHKLSQLRQGQQGIRIDDELVSEFSPLKQALNEFALAQDTNSQRVNAELNQSKFYSQQQEASCHELQLQLDKLQQDHRRLQLLIQQRLTNLRQLCQHSLDMDTEQLQSALTGITNLLFLEHNITCSGTKPVRLTELVATAVVGVQQSLVAKRIDLQVIETDGLAEHQVDLAEPRIHLLLVALLQLTARVSAASELVLRLRLYGDEQAMLQISVTCNGNGIPARVVQLLNATDIRPLQWHEADIGCIIAVRQQSAATMSVQSLDGLGSTLTIQLPVTKKESSFRQFQHVLLFDDTALLPERIRSLSAVAQNVVSCADISELQRKSTQHHYDLTLIFLPEPAELLQWQQLLSASKIQGPVLLYARAPEQQIWREALNRAIEPSAFCLQHLAMLESTTALPQLLVVDDNPTNLAFVKVLLQSQPVDLATAASGQDALQLCRQQRFDIILLDIQLPDISGIDVALELRQLAGYQQVPILAFTAHALEQEVATFKRSGMNDVILKPLDAGKLEQIMYWCSRVKVNDASQ